MGSAVHNKAAGLPHGTSLTDMLLADLWSTWTGERHPLMVPVAKRADAAKHHERVVALRAHAARMAMRQARLDAAAASTITP